MPDSKARQSPTRTFNRSSLPNAPGGQSETGRHIPALAVAWRCEQPRDIARKQFAQRFAIFFAGIATSIRRGIGTMPGGGVLLCQKTSTLHATVRPVGLGRGATCSRVARSRIVHSLRIAPICFSPGASRAIDKATTCDEAVQKCRALINKARKASLDKSE